MLLPQSFPEHFRLYSPNLIPPLFKEKDRHTRTSKQKKPQAQSTVALDDYLLSVVNTQVSLLCRKPAFLFQ